MGIRKATWLAGTAALVGMTGNAAAAPLLLQDVPLFISSGAEPNVMLMVDNSGSMTNIVPDAPFDPKVTYLAICPAANTVGAGANINLALSGTSPRARVDGTDFQWGTGAGRRCFDSTTAYLAMLDTGGGGFLPAQYTGNYLNWYFDTATDPTGCANTWSSGRKPCAKSRIMIARTAGVNLVNSMPTAMRTGLSTYNNGNGGQLLDAVGNLTAAKRTSLATAINGLTPAGNTPLAETLSDIGFYFSRGATDLVLHPNTAPTTVARSTVFDNGYTRDSSWGNGSDPVQFSCQKSFAVLLTDGRPQGDQDMSASLADYDGDCASPATCLSFDRKATQVYESAGSDYLNDVAQALFEVDMRPDLVSPLGAKNNVATYLISFADDQAINDPLMQSAADQGGGEKLVAGNEQELTDAFASALASIVAKTASASSASVNSGSISSDTRVYQAKFNSATWTGQLLSFPVNPDGSLVTDLMDPRVWDASDQIPAADSRKIITMNSDGVTPVPFRWNAIGPNPAIDAARKNQLGAATDAVKAEALLNYLRGVATNEGSLPANYRTRTDASGANKLGDIVSSSPLFIGRPPFRYRDSLESKPYSAFVTSKANRDGMVYVGANDGMLHGFDSDTGREVFSYIPSPVFARLPNISSKTYAHEFYVDGSPSMGDAFFAKGVGAADWHTVLVGGLNKGGRGIYALDVTDPSVLSNAESNARQVVLWEFTSANDADLGLTYSQPTIVKLQDGRWAAVFGNGYNSGTNKAVLYIVDISNGSVIRKLEATPTAPLGVTWDNGLSTPSLVDVNGDRKVDFAYAGDLFGNMWKFDLSSTTSGSWAMSKLFAATDANAGGNGQPITVRPEVGRGPRGSGTIVLFGTGKYLELTDKSSTRVQSFYGIIDRGSTVLRSSLLQQSISNEFAVDPDGAGPLATINARVTTSNALLPAHNGWYMNLVPPSPAVAVGEKQVTNPIIRDGKVVFTTLLPNADPCGSGGTSWLMELDMLSGAKLILPPFDINQDGQFTDADMVPLPSGGFSQVSGIQFGGAGILQSPGVIEGETGAGVCMQYKYMPDSAGNIQVAHENCGPGGLGRQSWRQIR